MGVVTAMALVEYFAKHPPLRTIIFIVNNGEEDGLWGARIFMEHPWSKLPKAFLNLEGGEHKCCLRTCDAADDIAQPALEDGRSSFARLPLPSPTPSARSRAHMDRR